MLSLYPKIFSESCTYSVCSLNKLIDWCYGYYLYQTALSCTNTIENINKSLTNWFLVYFCISICIFRAYNYIYILLCVTVITYCTQKSLVFFSWGRAPGEQVAWFWPHVYLLSAAGCTSTTWLSGVQFTKETRKQSKYLLLLTKVHLSLKSANSWSCRLPGDSSSSYVKSKMR